MENIKMETNIINKLNEPLGWAELECLLSYKHLTIDHFEHAASLILSLGFKLYEDSFRGFTIHGEGLSRKEGMTLQEYLLVISSSECNVAAINTLGFIRDVPVKLSLCTY